jgi:hypothetical protein
VTLLPEVAQAIGAAMGGAVGGAVGGFAAAMSFYRRRMRSVARGVVDDHEERCARLRAPPLVTPALGTPRPYGR